MPSIHPEDLTPFGRLALKLDREFSELVRAGEQMARVDVETDSGLDEGLKILNRVAQYGESLAGTMQEFSTSLQEARDKAEAATQLVAERAQLIKQRRLQQDQLQDALDQLREGVKAVGATLTSAPLPGTGALSDEDKLRIAAELQRLQGPMDQFIEAAQTIKAQAARLKFKRLERGADAMIDSLQASRRKIAQALSSK